MSLEGEEAKRKWKCKYCTYENFPSSIKCTMCREEKVLASLNSDIYQLAYAGPSLCSNDNEEVVSGKFNWAQMLTNVGMYAVHCVIVSKFSVC